MRRHNNRLWSRMGALLASVVLLTVGIPTTSADHDSDFPLVCGDLGTALPWGSEIHGQAGSSAQLYRGPTDSSIDSEDDDAEWTWYVSYVLETNTMSVGADRTAFFTRIHTVEDGTHDERFDLSDGGYFFEADRLSGNCKWVATTTSDNVLYLVQGGATGWATSETCGYEIRADVEVGIVLQNPGLTVKLGGSLHCENGAVLDSEVLVGEDNSGTACPPGGCSRS